MCVTPTLIVPSAELKVLYLNQIFWNMIHCRFQEYYFGEHFGEEGQEQGQVMSGIEINSDIINQGSKYTIKKPYFERGGVFK